ncbi:MAG: type I-E CRISPR-associated protein Cse2/CasB [Anaerolineaceae bacterium]|nr:type I-E CRISPR-associated protein Cse2/CasB [Anaerolineaceae bacterium]
MTEMHPFIGYLASLREDRGALAALRRGLGQPPGTVASMYPYVVRWLPREAYPWQEAAYYMVAALFSYHPAEGGAGNMGQHMARARDPQGDDSAMERRFTALLAAHPDDLAFYLRQTIGFLRSKEVPVNWGQLLADILAWDHPDRYIQQQWARSFWGRPQTTS